MSLKLCLDTTAEVQRGAEGGWRSAQVDWMLLGWVEGVTPALIVLKQGTVGCWCRHTCCPCQEPGLKLSSLMVVFLQRQAGVVDANPARIEQVRVRAS